MSNNSSSLYGIPHPKATASKKDLTSSSTLAFTNHLSSLISKDANRPASSNSDTSATRGRARPSKTKSDIFSVHNRNAHKRAAADISDNGTSQIHQRASDIGEADAAALHRSKRKMTEKAKLYSELKSGNYLIDSDNDDDDDDDDDSSKRYSSARRGEDNSLVDFDRKWAEEEQQKKALRRKDNGDSESSDNNSDSDSDDSSASLVDYEDEFGRARRGTKSEAARASRAKHQSETQSQHDTAGDEPSLNPRARPSRPENLIYGETVQSSAFDPSAVPEMANLAKRRDRTPTPPPETHYDADAEVRNRGTGFYAFSKDEEVRKGEMEDLMGVRKETERERERAGGKKGERERKKEERRKQIEKMRGKRRAENFLKELGEGLGEAEVEGDGYGGKE